MGKTCIVTGCSSGIGLHCARGMAARGWRVFASARRQSDVDTLINEGFDAYRMDMDDSESIQTAVSEVLKKTGGRMDAVFANAGMAVFGAIEDLPRDAWRAQFESNFFGPIEFITRIIPIMRQQGSGRIVICSSVLGYTALPYRGSYVSSKHSIEAAADVLRLELMGSGVCVSLLQPGPIISEFRKNSLLAFQRWVNAKDSRHAIQYEQHTARLAKVGPASRFTLEPEAVLEKLIIALESSHPRARYRVTIPSHLMAVLRFLPTGLLDRLLGSGKLG